MLSDLTWNSKKTGPFVEIVHGVVPGRVRLRVTALHRSERVKQAIESNLAKTPDIASVSASTLTSTVLVVFGPAHSFQDIADAVLALLTELTGNPGQMPTGKVVSPVVAHPALQRAKANAPLQRSTAQSQDGTLWHAVDAKSVVTAFHTSITEGLSETEALRRLEVYGLNCLPQAISRSGLSIFLGQFKSLPVLLLGASAVLSVFTGGVADAIVIMGVVLINAGIGYVTESQAEKTINALSAFERPPVLVLRAGKMFQIATESVVPGEVLILTPGCLVPADARLVAAKNLTIDESSLTGESIPATKSVQTLCQRDLPLADRSNMVYMGTVVTGGNGLAVVVASGRYTELGTIQSLVGETRSPETPMQRQLDSLGNQMVMLSGAICVLVFGVGLLRGYGWLQMLKSSVSLAVAAVPEGLPTVATTTLALGIRNMHKQKVLIRHLDAVETLGAVQVICLDKTGTLTMNRMSVLAVHVGMARLNITEGRFFGQSGKVNPYEHDELLRLLHIAVLCNEAEVSGHEGQHTLNGSATENALIEMAIGTGIAVGEVRAHYLRIKTEYRAEGRNYMSTWHKTAQGSLLHAVKGSPDEVLAMCRWHLQKGRKQALSKEARQAILLENDRMAGEALRVLGFAYGETTGEEQADAPELIWLGLTGMADPIRQGTKGLISLFHQAGIQTVMITGDQSATAYAIGKELQLSGESHLEILDSTHLEKLDSQVLSGLAQRVDIFSRVSPAHKLQIVQALQQAGKVVAMTGDGINDGPALKAADIGVAMGAGGTEVARTVADVVLEDDNLQTMIVAVSQGRTIYNNIRKSVHFLVSTNMSEIEVMLASIGAGLGQPLNTMQLLWINLMTDVFPALALAMEPPEPDILRRPPRDPQESIIRHADFKRYGFESLVITTGAMAGYGYGVARYGIGPHANTIAFMGLTMAQLLHAYSCRSETHSIFTKEKLPRNRYLEAALAGSVALQLGTVLVPGVRGLLGTTALTLTDALVVAGAAGLPYFVNEATKPAAARMQPERLSNVAVPLSGN